MTAPSARTTAADGRIRRMDVNMTVGAPSPTIVIDTPILPTGEAGARQAVDAYQLTRHRHADASKVIFIARVAENHYLSRFAQIQPRTIENDIGVASGRDCINSTVAAYPTILRAVGPNASITVTNADTGLAVAMRPGAFRGQVDLEVTPAQATQPGEVVLPLDDAGPAYTVVQVNNPYLLIDAENVGICGGELLTLDGGDAGAVMDEHAGAITCVRELLGIPSDSDLPKVALLAWDRHGLVARTIYLGRWHPGLPLTGVISFATATQAPTCGWYSAHAGNVTELRSRHDRVSVSWSRRADGAITTYRIPDRKVLTCAALVAS